MTAWEFQVNKKGLYMEIEWI